MGAQLKIIGVGGDAFELKRQERNKDDPRDEGQ